MGARHSAAEGGLHCFLLNPPLILANRQGRGEGGSSCDRAVSLLGGVDNQGSRMEALMDCWLLTSTDLGVRDGCAKTAFLEPISSVRPRSIPPITTATLEPPSATQPSHRAPQSTADVECPPEHHQRGLERSMAHDDAL